MTKQYATFRMHSKKARLISYTVLFLFCVSGCQPIWYGFLNRVVDIAPERFVIETQHLKRSVPIYTTAPLTQPNDAVTHLMVIIHGAGLNAEKSFEIGRRIVKALEIDADQALVVAPQFLEGIDPDEDGLLVWDRDWRSGGISTSRGVNRPAISSFGVIDELMAVIIGHLPNLQRALILGHSAGGQFVSRYAVLNHVHEVWVGQKIAVQYIVANPSSYLYLDAGRYQIDADGKIVDIPQGELDACPNYNAYKYGLENLVGYGEASSPNQIRERLLTRPTMFLIGTADTDRTWSMDKTCEGDAQGLNRYARWRLYKHHLEAVARTSLESPILWLEVPEVGHNAAEMFTHLVVTQNLKESGW